MATTIGLKIPNWEINKSEYEEVDSYFLMPSPGPVVLILFTYLLFVLKIGPSLMKNRKPFGLNKVLIAYNAIQVVISAYLVQRYFTYMLKTDNDILQTKCHIRDPQYRGEILTHIWLYHLAKVTELLDTVFFVLRKKDKQVTFLHIYHHSLMMIATWAFLKYSPQENVIFIGLFNSLVHVLMYTYYGLAALGPEVAKYLTWKKYMTGLQLVQFVSMIVNYLVALKYSECPPSRGLAVFITVNIVFFLYLFGDFYNKSYKKNDKTKLNLNGNVKVKSH